MLPHPSSTLSQKIHIFEIVLEVDLEIDLEVDLNLVLEVVLKIDLEGLIKTNHSISKIDQESQKIN